MASQTYRTIRLTAIGSIACLPLLIFSASAAQKEKPPENLKFSRQAKAGLKNQQAKIEKELAAGLGDEWWGEYYQGDGLGVNVTLSMAPKSGFAFTWTGCLGLYDLNYGDVVFENGRYKLQFRYPNKREGFEGIAPELIPVRWGSRHYLIPADDFVRFANAVNSGFEASTRSIGRRFLLKRGDGEKSVAGFPDVPVGFKPYLLASPVRAQVTSVGESKTEENGRVTRVVLNVGTTNGVKPGMEFYVYEPSTIFETAKIRSLSEHSAEAEIHQYNSKQPSPSKDWQLSTYALTGRE